MPRQNKAKARIKRQKATNTPTAHQQIHLTMQQEARNTEGRNLWRPGSHLRHQAVQFVSAGELQPDREDHTETPAGDSMTMESQQIAESQRAEAACSIDTKATINNSSFFIDVTGDAIKHTGLSNPVTRLLSPDVEDSSEDEIVFHGRQNASQLRPRLITDSTNVTIGSKDGDGHQKSPVHPFHLPGTNTTPTIESISIRQQAQSQPQGGRSTPQTETTPPQSGSEDHSNLIYDDNDILADYIANVDNEYEDLGYVSHATQNSGTLVDTENHHGPICHNEEIPIRSGRNEHTQGGTEQRINATDREGVSNMQSGRARSDLTATSEQSNSDFESILNNMSDIESDEDLKSELDALDTLDLQCDQGKKVPRSQRYRYESEGNMFASATAFADALDLDPYYGLDVMDFSRPSLRKKVKGKRQPLDFEISDSELESELVRAWKNDREKKKTRKQKREDLRSKGLLGRSTGDADLKSKYSDGMGLEDLKTELRVFLLSSKNSLPLPPMAKQRRKIVHDLANAFSLKSQSRGKGMSRFPILHKTSRTMKFNHKTIFEVDQIFLKGKFKHGAPRLWDSRSAKPEKNRRVNPNGSVSYMDGDVVGASAPEIGAGNKGRAMLEKMGWSTGTALGATNNKGILLPVAHVVKNSKAGLG